MSPPSTDRHARRPNPDILGLLDQVEDGDRALLAMLLESVPDDDIAATLGISGAAVRRRRVRLLDGLGAMSRPATPGDIPARLAVSRAGSPAA